MILSAPSRFLRPVEDGVGADQTQEGTEVAAKPYGQGWNQVGEGLGIWDGDAPRGGRTLQPPVAGRAKALG